MTSDDDAHDQLHAQRRAGHRGGRAASQPRRGAAARLRPAWARARAAARACAAAARCWWTARPCRAAFISRPSSMAPRCARSRALPTATSSVRCRKRSSRRGAFQCGFCTPGFVLMTTQLLDENPGPGRGRDPALSLGQSVPLRGLSGDHRGGENRGAQARGRVAGMGELSREPREFIAFLRTTSARRGLWWRARNEAG